MIKIFKGIGIAFILTLIIITIGYLLFELAIYWDHHLWTIKNRVGYVSNINSFMVLVFIHSCYCIAYEFISRGKKWIYRLWYLYPLIVFVFIILLRIDESTYGMMLRLSAFTIPFVILTRGITERLIVKEKFIQTILNWKIVYSFWAISFIVLFAVQVTTNLTTILKIYWWTLGIATTLVGLYLLCKKQWTNSLLYFCLFLFPMITFKLGMLVKELLIYGQLK